ncbi:MAG: Gfo/Idh/MocA family oxidoreductase, partial [Chitinophagaceae bacterium]|nr:Gfo/Idh/MocA family oxidoreductase [Chitinophagaceae bacterium]
MSPINTALCSFGMSGKLFHAPFIHLHEGFKLMGAWERSNKIIKNFYPDAVSYNNYEELLADEKIELVIVNTPNITHYDFAKKALLANKHVVLE